MVWIYYLVLAAVLLIGLLITILGLPGLWLMVGSVGLYALLPRTPPLLNVIWVLLGTALVAEIVEFLSSSAGAKKAGGTKRGMVGGVVGALLGGILLSFLIPIPVLGTIIGVCLGAFVGAAGVEMLIHGEVSRSIKVGAGAAAGRFIGVITKLGFGILILLIALWFSLPLSSGTNATPAARGAVQNPTTNSSTQPG
jgi:uncharacterized protein YqgC (DUF456 family)